MHPNEAGAGRFPWELICPHWEPTPLSPGHTHWTEIYWPHLALEVIHVPTAFSWFSRAQQHISPVLVLKSLRRAHV